jgi:DNA repair protein RadC
MPIKEWSEDDRPREKLITNGAEACSVAELLAILITNGTRSKSAVQLGIDIMNACGNNLVALVRSSMDIYQGVEGIGPAKACIIKAAAELGRRIHLASLGETIKVNSPEDAYNVMSFLRFSSKEEFWILCTNNSGMMVHKAKVGDGSGGEVMVDFRKIASHAISCNATRIILCHNHPGGSNRPSAQDIDVTREIIALMKPLRISVVEHIIVAGDTYYSFLENDIL